ncbi:Peptidoglycan-binding domain 1 protein [Dickeya parazeae Ech586]|uniref:Peptidoglycan-binding domain 1 protein n=1 Tax=Dickeya zeae (strain Ech586) TaxID=590409 RepID=D2BWN9_DICZ5|nr:N-acetylmuramidase family protein [Dickeya parazeae]ACZ78392.1 Peptidoglycan-binding domain 1 protein [Dickeya parazeae Ech586]
MEEARIAFPVGKGQVNRVEDVKTVQQLLNSRSNGTLSVDGIVGIRTQTAITHFQRQIVGMHSPDGIVSPNGPTLRKLNHLHIRRPATSQPSFSSDSGDSVSEELYLNAARELNCEVAAIKAVVMTETALNSAFLSPGKPKILYERHYFRRLTQGRYDRSHPDISGSRYTSYGLESQQYERLETAIILDRRAAWMSASWGAFQIMGENYRTAGFDDIESFVSAMRSIDGQVFAFINHVKNTPILLSALRHKDWVKFARSYNGVSYAEKHYDVKIANNYQRLTNR